MIASRAFGPSVFQGGEKTATAGLFFHFVIALTAAFIYYTFSRKMVFLLNHPLLFSLSYGIAVHLVISRFVVPLSFASKREFSTKVFVTQCSSIYSALDYSIALTISHFAR